MFDGVRILIYRPASAMEEGVQLPALVFIHGGGYIMSTPGEQFPANTTHLPND